MKTKKQVISEHPEYRALINAVISGLGDMQSITDVNNHGIDGGYGDFIYYADTHRFAMKHRNDIISLLEESATDLGEEVVNMVSNFGIFRNNPMDNEDRRDLYKYLGGGRPDQGTITNIMAWFAAEEICRWFES